MISSCFGHLASCNQVPCEKRVLIEQTSDASIAHRISFYCILPYRTIPCPAMPCHANEKFAGVNASGEFSWIVSCARTMNNLMRTSERIGRCAHSIYKMYAHSIANSRGCFHVTWLDAIAPAKQFVHMNSHLRVWIFLGLALRFLWDVRAHACIQFRLSHSHTLTETTLIWPRGRERREDKSNRGRNQYFSASPFFKQEIIRSIETVTFRFESIRKRWISLSIYAYVNANSIDYYQRSSGSPTDSFRIESIDTYFYSIVVRVCASDSISQHILGECVCVDCGWVSGCYNLFDNLA